MTTTTGAGAKERPKKETKTCKIGKMVISRVEVSWQMRERDGVERYVQGDVIRKCI